MQPSEAQIVIDRATKLFPKWGPTAEEIEQWALSLANLDFAASQQAVESVWRKTKRASMVYAEFCAEYAAIFQRRQGNHSRSRPKTPIPACGRSAPPKTIKGAERLGDSSLWASAWIAAPIGC